MRVMHAKCCKRSDLAVLNTHNYFSVQYALVTNQYRSLLHKVNFKGTEEKFEGMVRQREPPSSLTQALLTCIVM